MDVIIRKETPDDYSKVEEVTRQAFAYPERIERGKIGCPYEHWMVNELRRRDGEIVLAWLQPLRSSVILFDRQFS